MTDTPRKPLVIELEGEAPDPGAAPPVPEDEAPAMVRAVLAPPPSRLTRFAVWAFSALGGFVLSVVVWDFVTGLLARNSVLGTVALALVALAGLAAVALAGREALAYARLGRLEELRQSAAEARAAADLKAARAAVAGMSRLYAGRAEARWGLARLEERQAEVLDADAILDLAEVELLVPLDRQARAAVEAAARQVAGVTALVPLALADVAVALWANLRLTRRIAEIYGSRAGTLGSWRLLRRVFAHLIATGALALTDDLIGSVAGGGILSKLSRRAGEGVINGALTVRLGLAAMELCRPLPFNAAPRPSTSAVVGTALAGFVGR